MLSKVAARAAGRDVLLALRFLPIDIEADPPRKLVQTWRAAWEPELLTEGFKRVTWEIDEGPGGVTKLTLTHELSGSPRTATTVSGKDPQAGGAWSWILSDLKTLLETGKSLAA